MRLIRRKTKPLNPVPLESKNMINLLKNGYNKSNRKRKNITFCKNMEEGSE
jgi:hypothetical protein